MKEKVILVDCDGVLLDWVYAFTQWMDRHGYKLDPNADKIYSINQRYNIEKIEGKRLVRMFNESAVIRKLPPLRDAMKYVKKLHEQHGYVFHAITSLSNDQYAQHLRTKNLIELFGPTPFEKYVYLDTGADKDEALEEYRDTGCYWIEDKPENCDVGSKMGLESLLVAHEHNANYKGHATRVQNWKEIYKIITE
jgi:FMN phosphatase YigB (HAD superfamily)|tara:strand:+ start:4794 stop:5375 length:582 start_codon:yes stop_codon:yes gene_type:complete